MAYQLADSPPLPAASLTDDELAVALAEGAGAVLLGLRHDVDASGAPLDDKALRAAGDQASQEWLAAALSATRPDDVVLSEEAKDDATRLIAERVWIIDPLDGTREFAERDGETGQWRDDFAVHIALWQQGKGLTVGAVSLPARGQVYSSGTVSPVAPVVSDAGMAEPVLGLDAASAATETASAGKPLPLRIAASRTRPPAFVADLAASGAIDLVPMGSAGVKVISAVDGTVDGYLHAGGQYEWDSAAPVAVAQAAGLICTRLDGSDLAYNQPDPYLPDLFIAHPAAAAQLRALVAQTNPSTTEA